jgi:hypothetical protein
MTVNYGVGPTLGSDAPIPRPYRIKLYTGIEIAWRLTYSTRFLDAFRKTIDNLTYRSGLPPEVYASALNSMIINYAEGSRNPLVRNEVSGKTHLEGSQGRAPAFTSSGQTWLRAFLLQGDPRRIGGVIMHEAAHYAGAPGHPLAEWGLNYLDEVSGLPR